MSNNILIVLCTCPDETSARQLAEALVRKKLAACVNIVNQISSVFAWQGKISAEQESLLLIKTTEQAYFSLENSIKQQHPYDVAEIIAVPVHQGSADYLNWVRDSICID